MGKLITEHKMNNRIQEWNVAEANENSSKRALSGRASSLYLNWNAYHEYVNMFLSWSEEGSLESLIEKAFKFSNMYLPKLSGPNVQTKQNIADLLFYFRNLLS